MNTLLDVKQRVRALIGDPDGDFATDAYLLPLINQAYEAAILYLENSCSPVIEKLVDLPAVPAGTTSFAQYQTDGQPLVGLETPLRIEWKLTGQPEDDYWFAIQKQILPNVSPANYIPIMGVYWEWRAGAIYVTPLQFEADFRIRGDFSPGPLVKDTDRLGIHPRMATGLAFATAALIGGERANPGYIQNWGSQAIIVFDDIGAILSRQQQGTSIRIGRMNGGRRNNGWGAAGGDGW